MLRQTGTQATSYVSLLSILTILVQFAVYYFFSLNIVIWGIAFLISAICCHVILEETAIYRICFDYSFLTVFISLLVILLTFPEDAHTILPYSDTMIGIAVINWLIPMTYCFIRNMISSGSKGEEFNSFYRNSSILFLIFYAAILVYGLFFKAAFPWAYDTGTDTTGFTPFEILAVQIEDCINGDLPLSRIFIYLASRILIFIPYGFYIRLILRNKRRFVRILSLLILPLILEILQYLFIPQRCSLDDLVYALIGGFLGFFVYFLINTIYRAFSGKNFLDGADYRRLGRSPLHF